MLRKLFKELKTLKSGNFEDIGDSFKGNWEKFEEN